MKNANTTTTNSTNNTMLVDHQKSTDRADMNDNVGAALFLYKDEETGITQKFAMSLRFYFGANDTKPFERIDGLYEFSVNGSQYQQRSYAYGAINIKRSQWRQNNHSGEFVLMYDDNKGGDTAVRGSVRISLNEIDEFIKYRVSLNEIPIKRMKVGRDVVVDWYFYDDFDTGEKMWLDANGLEMIRKQLFFRREYSYLQNNTISANYYPMTSAIAIRDHNETTPEQKENLKTMRKQILVLNDRSQGASAGLRGRRNIEIMQNRRFKIHDHYGVVQPLNDLDEWGRGIQVTNTYKMLITNLAVNSSSHQREIQRKQDQPLLTYFSQDYKLLTRDEFNVSAVDQLLKINNTIIMDIQEQLLTANLTNQTNGTAS